MHRFSSKCRRAQSGGFQKPQITVIAAVLACAALVGWATELSGPAKPGPALRLTIQYRSGTFSLLSSSALHKVIPPSDSLPATSLPLSGFWYELQSPQGEVLYRRIIADPLTSYTEAGSAETGSIPQRAEVVPAEAVFSLLVPEAEGTNQLVLFSSPPGMAGKSQPATVVARIPIVSAAK